VATYTVKNVVKNIIILQLSLRDIGYIMIDGFKGRTFSLGDKVRVYRNLNNGKWSILATSGEYKNKVVGHLDELALSDVTFIVSAAGQARVRREGRKNVHAYAQGLLSSVTAATYDMDVSIVSYDPYGKDFFFRKDDENVKLEALQLLNFSNGKAYL